MRLTPLERFEAAENVAGGLGAVGSSGSPAPRRPGWQGSPVGVLVQDEDGVPGIVQGEVTAGDQDAVVRVAAVVGVAHCPGASCTQYATKDWHARVGGNSPLRSDHGARRSEHHLG